MATKTVCDRCENSWNDLKRVHTKFGCEGEVTEPQQWVTEKMCAACRKTVEARIAKAMAPPVKRGAKEPPVDAEKTDDA